MFRSILAATALLTLGVSPIQSQESVALVVKVDGTAQLQPADGDASAVAVGVRLFPGDRVVPAEGSEVVLVGNAGRKLTVSEAVVMESAEAVDRGDLFTRTVGVLASAATSDARSRPNRQGAIRPIPGEPTPVSPRNGIRTLDTTPTLSWAAVEGATEYTVQIRREGQRPTRLTSTTTSMTLTEALEPGHTYYWTVAAGRRAAREDSVVIASREERTAVETSMATIRELGFDPADDGQLLALVVYVDLGLYYEALATIEGIEATGAPLGADTLLLKGEILDALGRIDEARESFDAADALIRGR